MMWHVLLLGTNIEIQDGDTVIGLHGDEGVYDQYAEYYTKIPGFWKRAELYIVRYEFNEAVIVGRISHQAKWLKNNSQVKSIDIELWFYDEMKKEWMYPAPRPTEDNTYYSTKFVYNIATKIRDTEGCANVIALWRIKCPSCGDLH